jgi:hypothetical protein
VDGLDSGNDGDRPVAVGGDGPVIEDRPSGIAGTVNSFWEDSLPAQASGTVSRRSTAPTGFRDRLGNPAHMMPAAIGGCRRRRRMMFGGVVRTLRGATPRQVDGDSGMEFPALTMSTGAPGSWTAPVDRRRHERPGKNRPGQRRVWALQYQSPSTVAPRVRPVPRQPL